jgi:hypothetical protein
MVLEHTLHVAPTPDTAGTEKNDNTMIDFKVEYNFMTEVNSLYTSGYLGRWADA